MVLSCEDFLESYADMLTYANQITTDIRIAEDRLNSVTANYDSDGAKSGGLAGDSRNEALAYLADLNTRYDKLCDRMMLRKREIHDFLEHIDKYEWKRTLQLRHCDLKSITEIAPLLGVSTQSVRLYLKFGYRAARDLYKPRSD